jgi:hypothetical protein
MGASINVAAIIAVLSRIVGIDKGRSLPFGLGTYTRLSACGR